MPASRRNREKPDTAIASFGADTFVYLLQARHRSFSTPDVLPLVGQTTPFARWCSHECRRCSSRSSASRRLPPRMRRMTPPPDASREARQPSQLTVFRQHTAPAQSLHAGHAISFPDQDTVLMPCRTKPLFDAGLGPPLSEMSKISTGSCLPFHVLGPCLHHKARVAFLSRGRPL